MTLAGKQIGELRDIVCQVFTVDELRQVVKVRLNVDLEDIVGVKGQPKENIAYDLIEWFDRRDRAIGLLQALVAERPAVPRVRQFCEPLLSPAPPGSLPFPAVAPDVNQVRARVIEFSTVIGQRRDWFRYLNAYKTLHDVLHKLQDMQEAIDQAVERFGREPQNPVPLLIIANSLEDDLVSDATAASQNTEFPGDPGDAGAWVASFASSVKQLRNALAPPDSSGLGCAVEALRAMPNQQARLNKELVWCARRLKAEELVTRMDGILAGVGQIPDGDEFRARLTRFRALCEQLTAQMMDHDACQDIETSLSGVVKPAQATREQVFQWSNVLAKLLRIAARRPGDPMAARVADYARAFDAADESRAATNLFALLRDQFLRLFNKTDEVLLQVTGKLIQEADLLDARLRRFSL